MAFRYTVDMNKLAVALLTLVLVVGTIVRITSRPSNLVEKQADQETVSLEESEFTELKISPSPLTIRQGDPGFVTIGGVGTSTVSSLTFNGGVVPVFEHDGRSRAFLGVDLRASTGTFPLVVVLSDGRRISDQVTVTERTIATAPLGIPDKLGGNTPQSEQNLINTLVEEGRLISAVPSAGEKLWMGEFILPLKGEVVVTDTYGYSRLTGDSTISHKGTDYRATVGTPIYAMNSGRVVFTRELRNYGKTIVIDHGLGLHTIYMHLSEIGASLNQSVDKGQLIGKSGDTGYVLGPHLHLTIRINGVSIDPERFMTLFTTELR